MSEQVHRAETASGGFLDAARRAVADGPKPRQVVLTLLADYWLEEDSFVPAGAMVDLAGSFGVTATSARTVLSRLVRDSRTETVREGRRTCYRLTSEWRRRVRRGLDRLSTFGVEPQTGRWVCVAFSVPESQRARRHKLRAGLQWLGFAPLYDGLWVSPAAVGDAAAALLERHQIESSTIFEADLRATGPQYGSPVDAWDLGAIRAVYDDMLHELLPVLEQVRAGSVGDEQALVWRTEVVNVWRALPALDPGLPLNMLPDDWPRSRLRTVMEELYLGLQLPAERHVRDVVRRHAPRHVDRARAHGLTAVHS